MNEPVPMPRRLSERRVLPMFNGYAFDAVFVDDRGTCSTEQHPNSEGGLVAARTFHRYRDAEGKFWAIRCPASMTEQEGLRTLEDRPPGSAASILATLADERRGTKSRRREGGEE